MASSEKSSVRELTSECTFAATSNGQHYGWLHPAGASITVSRSKLVDGRYIHETAAFFDPVVSTDFGDHPSLTAFLAAAEVSGAILQDRSGFRMEVSYFPGLVRASQLARRWTLAQTLSGWERGIIYLRDADDMETHATLDFLAKLSGSAEEMRLSFVVEEVPLGVSSTTSAADVASKLDGRPALFTIPAIANTPNVTVIAKVTAEGEVFQDRQGYLHGVRLRRCRDIQLDVRRLVQKSSIFPEFVLYSPLPTLPIGFPKESDVPQTTVPQALDDLTVELHQYL